MLVSRQEKGTLLEQATYVSIKANDHFSGEEDQRGCLQRRRGQGGRLGPLGHESRLLRTVLAQARKKFGRVQSVSRENLLITEVDITIDRKALDQC